MVQAPLSPPSGGSLEPDLPTREDAPYVGGRLHFVFLMFLLIVSLFCAQVYNLTILRGPQLRARSEENFIAEVPMLAPRGRILDRHGEALAVNQTLFQVDMSRFNLKRDQISETLIRLSQLLNKPFTAEQVGKIIALKPAWKSITIEPNLTLEQILPVMEQSFELPGIIVTQNYRRLYPQGAMAGTITGFVGSITTHTAERFQELGYQANEKVGQMGAEKTFEDLLHGSHGTEVIHRDANGRPTGSHIEQEASPGQVLTLSIDMGLQRLANQLLQGWHGAIVAMDPRDGSVLAMAANPTYDPNYPSDGSSFNRLYGGTGFAPGSTYKIVAAAAGLLAGYEPTDGASCDGRYHLDGVKQRFPCHLRSGHGGVNLYSALQKSCNIYFYRNAHRVGIARMTDTSLGFGFGAPTGFDLAGGIEASGINGTGGKRSQLGKLLQMGIGQGEYITATPLQMARTYSAIGNGGTLYRPRVLQAVHTKDGELVQQGKPEAQGKLPVDAKQLEMIRKGLWMVTHERGGTAFNKGLKTEWDAAGKTGTAQTTIGKTPNAWFACYAPSVNPDICLVILVEESGHGGDVCTPLARQLLNYYYGTPEPVVVPPPKGGHVSEEGD